MQQPRMAGPVSSSSSSMNQKLEEKKKPSIPTPKVLISHYESQGFNSQEASYKVIDDLQNMLVRVVSSSSSSKAIDTKFVEEASRKLDSINSRISNVETKLDRRLGFHQYLVIGVSSVALSRGISAVWPDVSGAAVQLWNSVRGATKPSV